MAHWNLLSISMSPGRGTLLTALYWFKEETSSIAIFLTPTLKFIDFSCNFQLTTVCFLFFFGGGQCVLWQCWVEDWECWWKKIHFSLSSPAPFNSDASCFLQSLRPMSYVLCLILSLKPARGSNSAVFTNKNRCLLTQLGQIQNKGTITLESARD